MPEYSCICDSCDHKFSFVSSIQDYDNTLAISVCPGCKSSSIRRDFLVDLPHGQVKEIKTIGQLAEANEKKYGKELTEKMRGEHQTKREIGMKMLPNGMSRAKESGFNENYTRDHWDSKYNKSEGE